jgi:hypothetical protein
VSSSLVNVITTIARSLQCDELDAILIYSMSVSVDGFIADREGGFGWTALTRSSLVSTSRRFVSWDFDMRRLAPWPIDREFSLDFDIGKSFDGTVSSVVLPLRFGRAEPEHLAPRKPVDTFHRAFGAR